MKTNQEFALLSHRIDDYIIQNIIVCTNYQTASTIARSEFGEDAIAVDVTLYPVEIGNTYKDGTFYNISNEVIPRNPTEAEQISKLNATIIHQNTKIESLEAILATQDELLADILLAI